MYKQSKYYLGTLSPNEQDRLEEIKFYLYITKMIKTLHNPQKLLTMVNLICPQNLDRLLEPVIQDILVRNLSFVPTEAELVILLHKAGVSSRKIKGITTLQQDTIYKCLSAAVEDPAWYHTRTNTDTLEIIKQFNTQADAWEKIFSIGEII